MKTTSIETARSSATRAMIMVFLFFLFLAGAPSRGWAGDVQEAGKIVGQAEAALKNFLNDPDMKWFADNLKNAKGVYIVPTLLKGAFIFGVEGGNGVFLARIEKTGAWSEPAFFETSSASFGLQAGAQSQEAILLVMSPKGVESLLTSTVKLGFDGSIAIGPKGMGAEGSTAPNLSVDFLSFSRAKGLFAGVSFEGASIRARDELNKAYYGADVRPTNIIVSHDVKPNPQSKPLHATLAKATGGK